MTKIDNLVQQKSVSTGAGNLTLLPALAGRSFADAFGTGGSDMFFYFIRHTKLPEWEIGTGHLADAATLVRDTVISSSAGDGKVSFSAGDKDIVNDIPATQQLVLPQSPVAGDLLVYDGTNWSALPRGNNGEVLSASTDDLQWQTPAISQIEGLATALSGKAATAHDHTISAVTGLQTALDTKAFVTHMHGISDVEGLTSALSGKADDPHGHGIEDIAGLATALSSKAASAHSHTISDTTGLQTALDAKAATTHNHAIEDITDLATALADKAASAHSHDVEDITGLADSLAGLTPASRSIATSGSLSGGGTLADDRNLQLAGDADTPGNNKYYGTDAGGDKGFYDLPAAAEAPTAADIAFDDTSPVLVTGDDVQTALDTVDRHLLRSGFSTHHSTSINHLTGNNSTGPFGPVVSGTNATADMGETSYSVNQDALGVVRLSTGTTATGCALRGCGHAGLMLHENGKILRLQSRIRLEDLTASGSQEFRAWGGVSLGFAANTAPATTYGVYWYYDKTNADWILRRRAGVTTTDVATGITVAADTWYDMELVVTGNATDTAVESELFINGTSVASVSTLTAMICYNAVSAAIQKQVGTTARLMYVDYEALFLERST